MSNAIGAATTAITQTNASGTAIHLGQRHLRRRLNIPPPKSFKAVAKKNPATR